MLLKPVVAGAWLTRLMKLSSGREFYYRAHLFYLFSVFVRSSCRRVRPFSMVCFPTPIYPAIWSLMIKLFSLIFFCTVLNRFVINIDLCTKFTYGFRLPLRSINLFYAMAEFIRADRHTASPCWSACSATGSMSPPPPTHTRRSIDQVRHLEAQRLIKSINIFVVLLKKGIPNTI